MTDPAIVRAKITPPPVREATLARDRLLAWLDANITRRVITVTADTGYGKTTLLADFARRTEARCLWYRLDKADRDWVAFLNYLVAAGREFVPSLGASTLGMLQAAGNPEPPLDHVLSTFIAELDALATQPTVLVLDDYHLVDATPDIRTTLTRLITDAPAAMSFVMLSRRKPRLALGRLAAQGRVAALDSGDLRFSPAETESLFRDAYHLPLEQTVLAQVEQRTEGWAASLQMLGSSLQGRSPEAVRRVVENMTGAEGGVYEYLAEEVLAELEPALQRFLTVTAILETVTPSFARAILAADPLGPGEEAIERWTRDAHQEGLMARRDAFGAGERYHPLFRDLLLRHLRQTTSEKEIRGMHVRVARAAEDSDWLASSRHYSHAGSEADAVRVLSSNVTNALGTGLWGEAAELIHDLRAPEDDPRLAVVLAREDIYRGRLDEGLDRLLGFDLAALDSATRALLVQARIHALSWLARSDEILELAELHAGDPDAPEDLRELLDGARAVALSARDGSLHEAAEVLTRLAATHQRAGRSWYEGISRHNMAIVHLVRGDLEHARTQALAALKSFETLSRPPDEALSTHLELARICSELGHFDMARDQLAASGIGGGVGETERKLEIAHLLAVIGDVEEARMLVRVSLGRDPAARERNQFAATMAEARLFLSDGDTARAVATLGESHENIPVWTTGSWLSWMHLRTTCALAQHPALTSGAVGRATAGADLARRQGSPLFERRFQFLQALAGPDTPAIIEAARAASDLDLLLIVEAVCPRLHLAPELADTLDEHIGRWRRRWLPVLRRAVQGPRQPWTATAAALLDRHGDLDDVRTLRRLARSKAFRYPDLGRPLAKRRAPRVRINDLGRGSLEVDGRTIEVARMRRRAAATLYYLLSVSTMSAAKDQVLEALWPDASPEASVNSLNQSLYFLRREIDPGYDDDCSAQYLRLEGDLLWLDPDLVESRSHSFHAGAKQAMGGRLASSESSRLLSLYEGRFAPEFEYDDWASAWRELLHAQYLHLALWETQRSIRSGEYAAGIDAAVRVLAVDPGADQIEKTLIWLYGAVGSRAAAAEQYAHYLTSQEAFGPVPRLEELLAAPPVTGN